MLTVPAGRDWTHNKPEQHEWYFPEQWLRQGTRAFIRSSQRLFASSALHDQTFHPTKPSHVQREESGMEKKSLQFKSLATIYFLSLNLFYHCKKKGQTSSMTPFQSLGIRGGQHITSGINAITTASAIILFPCPLLTLQHPASWPCREPIPHGDPEVPRHLLSGKTSVQRQIITSLRLSPHHLPGNKPLSSIQELATYSITDERACLAVRWNHLTNGK